MGISNFIEQNKAKEDKAKSKKGLDRNSRKPPNYAKLSEKEKERYYLSYYDENLKLKQYQREQEDKIKRIKAELRAIEEKNGELRKRQNISKEEGDLLDKNLKVTQENAMLRANLVNLQDTVKKMFEENAAIRAKSEKQRKMYSTLSEKKETTTRGIKTQGGKKLSTINELESSEQKSQHIQGYDPEAQRLIHLLQKQLRDMKSENDRLQDLQRKSGVSPATQNQGGFLKESPNEMAQKNLKLVEVEHKLKLLQSTQEASQYRLEEATKSLQTVTNELIKEREARGKAEEAVKSMEISVMTTNELKEENRSLKAHIKKLENDLKEWTLSPFLSDQTDKATITRKLVDTEAKVIDLEARVRTATELERRSQEDLKQVREQLQKVVQERDKQREELIRAQESGNRAVQNDGLLPTRFTEQEIRMRLGLDVSSGNKPAWAELDLLERDKIVDLTDLGSCNREIIRLKSEKAELAAHLESAQNNLRIQRELYEAKERLFEKEKKKLEMANRSAQGRIEELSRVLAGRAGSMAPFQRDPKGPSGEFDYDDSVSVFSTATMDYRDMVELENLFDVYVGRVDLFPAIVNQFLTTQGHRMPSPLLTFGVLDFYNHEPQKTPPFEGFSPLYNFQFTFRMKVDPPFLSYCKDDSFKVEFFVKVGSQTLSLGKCVVRLLPLLQRTWKLFEEGHENTCAVISATDDIMIGRSGTSIGSMTFRYRIRQPFARALDMMIKTQGNLPIQGPSFAPDSESGTIVVLISRGAGFSPSSRTFVHYNLLGIEVDLLFFDVVT